MTATPTTLARPWIRLPLLALILAIPPLYGTGRSCAAAELAVAMSAASAVESLSRDQVVNIFLGRFRQLPDGTTALPVDQPEALPLRAAFYRLLVNKNPAEIRAYWARLVFSGKTAPPHQAGTPEEVLQWLRDRPGAIGYLDAERLEREPGIRAVFNLGALDR